MEADYNGTVIIDGSPASSSVDLVQDAASAPGFQAAAPGVTGQVDLPSGDIVQVYSTRAEMEVSGGSYFWCKNGAVYGFQERGIVRSPASAGVVLSTERAREMIKSRYDRGVQAALDGLQAAKLSGAAAVFNNVDLGSWSAIVKLQAELAMDTAKGRASTEAARFVGSAADLLPDRRVSRAESGASSAGFPEMSLQVARELVELVRLLRS